MQAEFAYNNLQHVSIQITPFLANWFLLMPVSPDHVWLACAATEDFLHKLQTLHQVLKYQVEKPKKKKKDYKNFSDQHCHSVLHLAVEDFVWLSTWNLPSFHPFKKLDHKICGTILSAEVINLVTYCLILPARFHVYLLFHRSLLVPAPLATRTGLDAGTARVWNGLYLGFSKVSEPVAIPDRLVGIWPWGLVLERCWCHACPSPIWSGWLTTAAAAKKLQRPARSIKWRRGIVKPMSRGEEELPPLPGPRAHRPRGTMEVSIR